MLSIKPFSVSFLRRNLITLASALGATMLMGACADPDGAFTDFTDRQTKIEEAGTTGSAGTGGGGGGAACTPPEAGDIEEAGNLYYLSLSAKLGKTHPLTFIATVTTAAAGDKTTFSMEIQPLSYKDRKTPVGPKHQVGPFDIEADGSFIAALPRLTIDGGANAITKDTDIEAEITLTGTMCSPFDFICGGVSGPVFKPIAIDDLKGSTFTMQRIESADNLPEAYLNCAKEKPAAL